jgi:hypothetical protein
MRQENTGAGNRAVTVGGEKERRFSSSFSSNFSPKKIDVRIFRKIAA